MTSSDTHPAWPHRPLRFIWQSDAEGRFMVDSEEFAGLMGPARAALLGRPWPEIATALGLDPDGHVARALASRETWSGVQLAWPVGDSKHMLVELSGLPVFDRERNFGGHRGFGVCRGPARGAARAPEARPAPLEVEAARPSRLRASLDALTQTAAGAAPTVISLRAGASASLIAQAAEKVVRLRPTGEPKTPVLTPGEANAFHELTRQLTERLTRAVDIEPQPAATSAEPRLDPMPPERDRDAAAPAPVMRDDLDRNAANESAVAARHRAEELSAVKSDLIDKIIGDIRDALDAGTTDGRLRALIDDLEHLAKAAAGEASLATSEIALNPMLQQCVAELQPRANRECVIIRSSLSPILPPVAAEARTTRAMLLELLTRTLAHAGTGRLVIVSTGTGEAGQVALRLRGADGGGGRGYDLERDLALAAALAHANGASLTVRHAVDAGALVEVTFPAR